MAIYNLVRSLEKSVGKKIGDASSVLKPAVKYAFSDAGMKKINQPIQSVARKPLDITKDRTVSTLKYSANAIQKSKPFKVVIGQNVPSLTFPTRPQRKMTRRSKFGKPGSMV